MDNADNKPQLHYTIYYVIDSTGEELSLDVFVPELLETFVRSIDATPNAHVSRIKNHRA